jgi:hypothetical protein
MGNSEILQVGGHFRRTTSSVIRKFFENGIKKVQRNV